jgi:hypothetical protein
VDEAERVDRPQRVGIDLGLVSTEDPMAGLVHLKDSRTASGGRGDGTKRNGDGTDRTVLDYWKHLFILGV